LLFSSGSDSPSFSTLAGNSRPSANNRTHAACTRRSSFELTPAYTTVRWVHWPARISAPSDRTRTEYAGKRSAHRNSSSPPSSRSSIPFPYPTDAGIQLYLDQLKIKNPKAAQADIKDYINARFVKELDDSGFIKALYRK